MSTKNSTSIYVTIAAQARVAAVFRRGPSRLVQLLLWDLHSDTFKAGQWFKGRIYERRSQLSPSGEYLVYFAASFRPPYFSWTAVSKPPYLTALALWPKGDTWGGGGHFETESKLYVNHSTEAMELAEGFTIPAKLSVRSSSEFKTTQPPGANNTHSWICVQKGTEQRQGHRAIQRQLAAIRKRAEITPGPNTEKPLGYIFDPPSIYERKHGSLRLEYQLCGYDEINGAWDVNKFRVLDEKNNVIIDLGRADWADWDKNGDLLFAKDGVIYRSKLQKHSLGAPLQLIDLSQATFEPIVAPDKYKQW